MFNLPTPRTAVGKLAVRTVLVALIAGLGVLLQEPTLVQGSFAYMATKFVYDLLNANIANY